MHVPPPLPQPTHPPTPPHLQPNPHPHPPQGFNNSHFNWYSIGWQNILTVPGGLRLDGLLMHAPVTGTTWLQEIVLTTPGAKLIIYAAPLAPGLDIWLNDAAVGKGKAASAGPRSELLQVRLALDTLSVMATITSPVLGPMQVCVCVWW